MEDASYCKEHVEKRTLNKKCQQNTEAEKQKMRSVLLGRHIQLLGPRHAALTEPSRRWAQQPENVAICDIEACGLSRLMSPINVFEVAIANARGQ